MSSLPSPPLALTPQLTCEVRPGYILQFKLKGEKSVIGCDPAAQVAIPADGVSRQHAQIVFDGKGYALEGLSTGGTFVNGRLVRKARLRNLDVITLGKKCDLLFELRDKASTVEIEGILAASLQPIGAGEPSSLHMGEVTLGRSSTSNIVLAQAAVSKHHAVIERTPAQVMIRDLASANGTFVNGERVTAALLQDGDLIALGNVVTFRMLISRGVLTAPTTAIPRVGVPPEQVPRFNRDWKTRFDWDAEEIEQIALLQKDLAARDAKRALDSGKPKAASPGKKAEAKPPGKQGSAPAAPPKGAAAPPAAKPADRPVPPAPAGGPGPAAPKAAPKAAGAPAPPPKAAAEPPVKPAPAQRPVPAAAAPEPAGAPPPTLQGAAPAKQVAPPPPPVQVDKGPAQPDLPATTFGSSAQGRPKAPTTKPVVTTAANGPISEVRLSNAEFNVVASAIGAHEMGRAKDNPLRIDHPTVSRIHARIIISDDGAVAYVQDRGGANGTWVNGTQITGIALVKTGDVISMGEVDLTVEIKRG